MQDILNQYETVQLNDVKVWFKAGKTSDFPTEGGGCIKYKNKQIAVINFLEEINGLLVKMFVHTKWKWFCQEE